MLVTLYSKLMQNKKKFIIGCIVYILTIVLARVFASLTYVSQPIIKFIDSPFSWWHKVSPINTNTYLPNPFWEWTYILITLIIVIIFIFGLYNCLLVRNSTVDLLCEEEVKKITKAIELNPNSVTSDTVIDMLKKFEAGLKKLFEVNNKRDFLCVWVYPEDISPGAKSTNNWNAFCTDRTNPENYLEIIATGVLKETDYKHFSSDLKSYNTEAKELAFVKNIGDFKFGVAVLFMESDKVISEEKQKKFIISTGLLHHLAQLDKPIMSVV